MDDDQGRRGRGAVVGPAGGDAPGAAPVPTVVAVDPRMRRRRIHVRRTQGRRRLRRALVAVAGAAVLAGGFGVTRTPLLDVDRVEVDGVGGARAREVVEAAAVSPDQPLASLDEGAVGAAVEELPWVASATVRRSWPATVRVEVRPRRVVAAVRLPGAVALVDGGGVVVAVEPGGGDGPPGRDGDGASGGPGPALVLTGVEGAVVEGRTLGRDARDALAVASAMADRLPGAVASVSTALEAELRQGGVVRFGSTDDLERKVVAVETVLDEVDTTCMAVLDVRVAGSPALTRNQGCP